MEAETFDYKRSRFKTRLPLDRFYVKSHFWLKEETDNIWQVGFTKFAARMLGELVESDYEVKPEAKVEIGQVVGWVEGFKAASDLYSVVNGSFVEGNPDLQENPELMHRKPYDEGWLYRIKGEGDPDKVDAHGYAAFLDTTIDKMQGEEK